MRKVSKFRKEDYGLFLDLDHDSQSKIAIPSSGAHVLLDFDYPNSGFLCGALRSSSFDCFSFGCKDGQITLSISYQKGKRIELGVIDHNQISEAVSWCIEATGLLETSVRQYEAAGTKSSTLRGTQSVEDFWKSVLEGRFENRVTRWLGDDGLPDEVFRRSAVRYSGKRASNLEIIHGVGERYSSLLIGIHIKNIANLAKAKPLSIYKKIDGLVVHERDIYVSRKPQYEEILDWVYQAKIAALGLDSNIVFSGRSAQDSKIESRHNFVQ